MEKVQMVVSGRLALVDADMVKKMTRKAELVASAMRLKNTLDADPTITQPILQAQLQETMSKIIRLNRVIRQTVQFL